MNGRSWALFKRRHFVMIAMILTWWSPLSDGLVWFGLVWFLTWWSPPSDGLVWFGLILTWWSPSSDGLVLFGLVWFLTWWSPPSDGLVWFGLVWFWPGDLLPQMVWVAWVELDGKPKSDPRVSWDNKHLKWSSPNGAAFIIFSNINIYLASSFFQTKTVIKPKRSDYDEQNTCR